MSQAVCLHHLGHQLERIEVFLALSPQIAYAGEADNLDHTVE